MPASAAEMPAAEALSSWPLGPVRRTVMLIGCATAGAGAGTDTGGRACQTHMCIVSFHMQICQLAGEVRSNGEQSWHVRVGSGMLGLI